MTNVDQLGPWLGLPDEKVREAFVAHMRDSAHPEHFDGVARDVRPPRDRGFRIIKKHVTVDPKKREDTFAPCNLCGPRPKFKNDGMLIADEFGWLYLIGPICGVQHYDRRFIDEERRFDREQAVRAAQEFLLAELRQIAVWNRNALALRTHTEAAAQAHRRLAKTGKVIAELRRAASKQDGWLRVDEAIQVLQANGSFRTEYRPVNVARLSGLSAVRASCNIIDRLRRAIAVLGGFGTTEETAFDHVADAEVDGKLPELAADLRGAVAMIADIRKEIEEFQAFFAENNYRAIERWASDARCPIQMSVECRGTTRTLVAARAHRRLPIDVSELLRPLPEAVGGER